MIKRTKFTRDVSWNLFAFAVMAVTAAAINVLIGRFYGPEALGIFNQIWALYIVVSQFAVFGIWLSTLRYVSEHSEDVKMRSKIIVSSFVLASAAALIVVLLGAMSEDVIRDLFDSDGVANGWIWVIPGLWAYATNKVLLAALNGCRDMRAFALAQISRYLMMFIAFGAALAVDLDGARLAIIFSWPELILLVGLLVYISRYVDLKQLSGWQKWIDIHARFGTRSFLSGALSELNTRVDVMMLGLFTSDARVGIYSIAAMAAEGVAQFSVVIRDNVNPLIAKYLVRNDENALRNMVRLTVRRFYAIMAAVTLIASGAYPFLISWLTGGDEFQDSYVVFLILAAGLAAAGGYLPLGMFLAQAGKPGSYTIHRILVVVTNVALNAVLIPVWGINGAALATALSFALSVLYLKYLVQVHTGIRI